MSVCICVFVLLFATTVVDGARVKSIDEIIMEAAPRKSSLDAFQMSPEGEVIMTVDLDIKMNIEQYMELKGNPSVVRSKRKAIRGDNYRWKNCYVYYEIRRRDFTTSERAVIFEAIKEWEKYTCLQFKNNTAGQRDKIVFQTGTGGCYSRLGRVGGEQEIGLSRGCVHKGVVVHEIGHAIGWIHEQARPDRDRYIRVNFNRIPEAWHSQFDKFPASLINNYGVRYDYRSIMHYSGNAVATRSIETLDPRFQSVIGQRGGLSFRDVHLANLMYDCASMICRDSASRDCTRFGSDAFLFKREGDARCQCFCPGETDSEILMPCDSSAHTTPAITTTAAPTTTTLATTAEPEPVECMDFIEDCAPLVEAGECKMDMERMYMLCQKSCRFCGKEKMCMDFDPTCPLLTLGGLCDRPGFENLMAMKCKKSCQLCTPVDPCQMQKDMGLSDVPSNAPSRIGHGIFTSLLTTIIFVCALR